MPSMIAQRALSRVTLLIDWISRPHPLARSSEELRQLAAETRGLALYERRTCPPCIRVRRLLHSLNIPLERRDILKSPVYRDDLLAGLGEIRTPCLRVEQGGRVHWIDEADEIIAYLRHRFDGAQHNSLPAEQG